MNSKVLQFTPQDVSLLSIAAKSAFSKRPLPLNHILETVQEAGIGADALDVVKLMYRQEMPNQYPFKKQKLVVLQEYRHWVLKVLRNDRPLRSKVWA